MKVGFMSCKHRFNEIGWNWWSDARYVGIAETILRSVVSAVGVVSIVSTNVVSIASVVMAILVSIIVAILGSTLITAVVVLWGISLFSTANFLGDNVILSGGLGLRAFFFGGRGGPERTRVLAGNI